MKQVTYRGPEQITVDEWISPELPANYVAVKVAYVGVCGTDLHLYAGHMDSRVTTPHVPGHEMSGVVARTGAGVSEWKIGEKVTVRPLLPCKNCRTCNEGNSHICPKLKFIGVDIAGAMQPEWIVPAELLHRIPEQITLRQGALIEPLAVAIHDVRMADLDPTDVITIVGAGPIGLLIGIVCVSRGHKTFITDIDQTRLDVAKSHGMIPVAPDKVEAAAREATNGLGTDVVFEVSGSAGGATLISTIVKPRGKIIVVGIHAELRQFNLQQIFHKEVTMQGARVYKSIDFDDAIAFLATRTKELEPLITKVFPVEDALEAYLSLTRGGSIKNLIAISEPAI